MAEIVTAFWDDGTNFSKDLRKVICLVLENGKVAYLQPVHLAVYGKRSPNLLTPGSRAEPPCSSLTMSHRFVTK